MANTASETSREGLVGQGTSQVQEVASSAQEKAVELKEQGKSKLGETLDERTNQAGEQARKLAQTLRQSGEQQRNQDDGQQIAGITEAAADRVERLGDYLTRASGNELLRDVENFARRRPWVIAGIGLVAGLSASRFLKASSERRFEGMQASDYSTRYGYGTSGFSSGGPYADEPSTRQSYATSG
jgi:ElaB/YqjD/DUF883 family membrane-anchored ribosome-binding protein